MSRRMIKLLLMSFHFMSFREVTSVSKLVSRTTGTRRELPLSSFLQAKSSITRCRKTGSMRFSGLTRTLHRAALEAVRQAGGDARQPIMSAPAVSHAIVSHRHGYQFTESRPLSTDTVDIPPLSDQSAIRALRSLLAESWVPVKNDVQAAVKAAAASTSDAAAQAALLSGHAAAHAVEEFGELLEGLRLEVDELSGGKFGGERVASLPEHVKEALTVALQRYEAYLAAFGADEEWLQRKVKEELGAQLLTLKQRCANLDPQWNKVSLLGTSGLSGSFIEQRAK